MSEEITFLKPKKRRRPFRLMYFILLHLLAAIALFFIGTALAVKFNLTNDGGSVDVNSRYFGENAEKYNQGFATDSTKIALEEQQMFQSLAILGKYYPQNAKIIYENYAETGDASIALRMLDAVNLKLKKNKSYQKQLSGIRLKAKGTISVFPWANYKEWKEFCAQVTKDKSAIDSVSKMTGVESRLIVTCLVGEQIRMFNSSREKFKKYVIPFSRLILTKNKGYGVTGIKQSTAQKIERNLFDPKSEFYAGKHYEFLLNVNDSFPELINDTIEAHQLKCIQRLIRGGDHYYSYLYTALFLRQFQAQWEKQGYTLAYRPEILGTLYNLGYEKSKPKKNPMVGGSDFNVSGMPYTFGGLCYEFYYSGELQDLFPLTKRPFIPTKELVKKFHLTGPPELTVREEDLVVPVFGN